MRTVEKYHSDRIEVRFENLGLTGDIPLLGRYNLPHAGQVLSPHRHKSIIEICYLSRGEQQYRVGGKDYLLRGSDVFVTFPGELHGSGNTPQEKGILYWLQVRMPVRSRKTFLGMARRDIDPLIKALNRLPVRFFKGPAKLRILFDEVIQAALSTEFHPRLRVMIKLIELLETVLQACLSHPRNDPPEDIREILKWIHACPGKNLGVEDLAERAKLSVSWFNAKFRRWVGIPPAEYVLRQKIEKAKMMLRRENSSVTQVAMDLGFSTSQYFATVFKRYTGRQPGRFRPFYTK